MGNFKHKRFGDFHNSPVIWPIAALAFFAERTETPLYLVSFNKEALSIRRIPVR